MPTGYTYVLTENGGKKTRDWIMEHLARAFGMCIMLRDDPHGLSREEIKKRIKEKEISDYHDKELKKVQEELAKYNEYTDEQWEEEYNTHAERIQKENEERIKESERVCEIYMKTKDELQRVINNTTHEITANVCRFGIEQIKTSKSDYKPYIEEIESNWQEYKARTLKDIQWDIEYHTEEGREDKERGSDRISAYEEMAKEVDRILGKEK